MVGRWLSAVVAGLIALVLALTTWVIASARIPAVLMLFSAGVSNYGLYLIPLGVLGVGISVLLARRRMDRALRSVATVTGAVCLIGVVAACFPVVASLRTADQHGANLSMLNYLTGGSNTGDPDESLSTAYNTIDGTQLLLDAKLPTDGRPGPHPAVVWVHGGGWQMGDRGQVPEWHKWLNDKGYAVFSIEYRMTPPPRWYQAPADVKCAVGWVKQHAAQYSIDPQRVMLAGGSAGGHLALMGAYADDRVAPSCAVTDTAVRAVAAFYPATDLVAAWRDPNLFDNIRELVEEFTGGTPDEVPSRYAAASPVEYVRPGLPPTLLMHGNRDHIVPYQQSVELADRLERAGVPNELLELPYADHAYDFVWGDWGTQISRQVFADFLAGNFPVN